MSTSQRRYQIPLSLTRGEWETLSGALDVFMDHCVDDGSEDEAEKTRAIIDQVDKKRGDIGCI